MVVVTVAYAAAAVFAAGAATMHAKGRQGVEAHMPFRRKSVDNHDCLRLAVLVCLIAAFVETVSTKENLDHTALHMHHNLAAHPEHHQLQ